VILPEAIVSALQDAVEADPGTEVTVDLGRREVRAGAAGGGRERYGRRGGRS